MRAYRFVAVAFLLSIVVGGFCSVTYAAPVPGAIFTTFVDGSAVNANHFDSKCAVYLDGGPGPHAPARAAGLPDGEYFFQVTDPSGKQLLSTDPVSNRRFTVARGVITAYTGTGGPAHPTGVDVDHGATTIGLANASCPTDFLYTPTSKGEYKVWATPVADFVGDPANVDNVCGNGCFHGFVPSKSKTDNFKANNQTATFCVDVQILTGGGLTPEGGWLVSVLDPLGTFNSFFTNQEGQVSTCGLTPGNYTVDEILGEGWLMVDLIVNGIHLPPAMTYSFTWMPGTPPPVIVFVNAWPE